MILQPIRDQVNPTMKKGGISQKQKVKQMQVVNVKVNVGKDQKPKRRQAPRKKKVAGDSIMLHRGNPPSGGLPPPHHGYAPIGTPLRLAGPGQSYANLPAPLQSARYVHAPSVMNPQASPAFIGSADELYSRNRNKNDDVRQIVNPSDITPIGQPSERMVKSKPAPGAGYIPSAPPAAEEAAMGPTPFQGEVPRINEPDVVPSERAMPSQPSAGYQMMSAPGYPSEEEREEMVSDEEDTPQAGPEENIPQAGTSKRPMRQGSRPTKTVFDAEQSGMGRAMAQEKSPIKMTVRPDMMEDPTYINSVDKLDSMVRYWLRMDPRQPPFSGDGSGARKRRAIIEAQNAERAMMASGKQAAMARGGRVKSIF